MLWAYRQAGYAPAYFLQVYRYKDDIMRVRSFSGILIVTVALLASVPFIAGADKGGRGKGKQKKVKNVKVKKLAPPAWGASKHYNGESHVYFPDYYTFYDPARGYVYWNNGYWVTSVTEPSFLSGVDLNTARIELLPNEALTERPELRYTTYAGQYPGRIIGVGIPIPPIK